jgi:DNA-binding NtrC family response regulator|tara:strand:+ start:636 stop:863 length:228 start_codon:yes stop_codon:yes gene_type:complete
MKHAQDIKRTESLIVEEERNIIKTAKEELDMLQKQGRVSEDLIKKLGTIIVQLQSLREGYLWRVINSTKQNHMLD